MSQLKAKMQQLEQMIGELQKEIAVAEQLQKAPRTALVAVKPAEAQVPPPLVPTDHIGQFTQTRDIAASTPQPPMRERITTKATTLRATSFISRR